MRRAHHGLGLLEVRNDVVAFDGDALPTPNSTGSAGDDARLWLQDTRDWLTVHGAGTKKSCNILMADGSVKVVIDETSLDLLAGAEIDFVEDLVGASFQVRNPNAKSSCGCGSSFSIG